MTVDRRLIPETALEQLRATMLEHFAQGQFHEVGIREICQAARVSPQTIYKYFGNKESLLTACIEKDMAQLSTQVALAVQRTDDPVARIRAAAAAFFAFYAANPRVASLVYLHVPLVHWVNRASAGQQQLLLTLYAAFDNARLAGYLPEDADLPVLLDMCAGSAQRLVVRWLSEGCPPDLLLRGERFTEFMLNGLLLRT